MFIFLSKDTQESFWIHILAKAKLQSYDDVKGLKSEITDLSKKRIRHFSQAAVIINHLSRNYFFGHKTDRLPMEMSLKIFEDLSPKDIASLCIAQDLSVSVTKSRVFSLYTHATELNIKDRQRIAEAFLLLFPESTNAATSFIPALSASVSHITSLQLPSNPEELNKVANALKVCPNRVYIKKIFFDLPGVTWITPDDSAVTNILSALPNVEDITIDVTSCSHNVLSLLTRTSTLKRLSINHRDTPRELTLDGLRPDMTALKNLEELNLSGFSGITGSDIKYIIEKCTSLKVLRIKPNRVSVNNNPTLTIDPALIPTLANIKSTTLALVDISGYKFDPNPMLAILSRSESLRYLSFDSCTFSQQLIDLPSLPHLKGVSLTETALETGLPIDIFALERCATSLENIDISYSPNNPVRVLDFERVRINHSVKELDMSSQKIHMAKLFDILDHYPGLRKLDISDNNSLNSSLSDGKFEKITVHEYAHNQTREVRSTYGLTSLNLQFCKLRVTKNLLRSIHTTFPSLKELKIGVNRFDTKTFDSTETDRNFEMVEVLNLEDIPWLDDQELKKVLKIYPSLKVLDVGNSKITGIGFDQDASKDTTPYPLEKIFLRNNCVTEFGLKSIITRCPKLKEIYLTKERSLVAEDELKKIAKTYPKIKFKY